MFLKVNLICLVMTAALAELHNHGHGHAYSSQSINIKHGQINHGQIEHGHIGYGHIGHGNIGLGHREYEELGYGHENHYEPISHHGGQISSGYHYAPAHNIHEDSNHGGLSHKFLGGHHQEHHIDYYAHPKYEFEYSVKDPHTGDIKSHHEQRDGDKVQGVYSLHDPHGSIRTVKYNADKKSGFNAIVKQETIHHHQPHHRHY